MAIEAQLADGRILEFPDGTDPAVIQSTVKRLVTGGKATPKPTQAAESEAEYDSGDAMGTGAEAIMAAATPKKKSVLEGAELPAPLPTEDKYVVRPEFINAVQAKLNAAPAETRTAVLAEMAKRPDVYGRAARAIAGRYEAQNKVVAPTLTKATDLRLEQQTQRFIDQGVNPEVAEGIARNQALSGQIRPDLDQMRETPKEVQAGQELAYDPKLQGIDATIQAVQRVGWKTAVALGQAGGGMQVFAGDLLGLDTSDKRDTLKKVSSFTESMGDPALKPLSILESAVTSIGQQLPAMVFGVATGSEPLVLASMFANSFGQNYEEGRRSKLNVADSTARAAANAALEILGEKFGLKQNINAIKTAMKGVPSDQLANFIAITLKKEVPGELLTYAGQYAVDMGYGMKPEASIQNFVQGAIDTMLTTVAQGGIMAGGRKALTAIAGRGGIKSEAAQTETIRSAESLAKSEGFLAPLTAPAKERVEPTFDVAAFDKSAPPAPPVAPTVARPVAPTEQIKAVAERLQKRGISRKAALAMAEREVKANEPTPDETGGATNVVEPINTPSGESVDLAGQPSAEPAAARVGVTEPSGVVSAGQDVAGATTGETVEPTALEETPPVEPPAEPPTPKDRLVTYYNGKPWTYFYPGAEVVQSNFAGAPAKVVDVKQKRGEEAYYVLEVDVSNHPDGVDDNGDRVNTKTVLVRDDELNRLNRPAADRATKTPQAPAAAESTEEAGQRINAKAKNDAALSVVKGNIDTAEATQTEYGGLKEAFEAHRDNVVDTLKEVGETDQRVIDKALDAYDNEVNARLNKGAELGTETPEAVKATQEEQAPPTAGAVAGKTRGRPPAPVEVKAQIRVSRNEQNRINNDAEYNRKKFVAQLNQTLTPEQIEELSFEEAEQAEIDARQSRRSALRGLVELQGNPNIARGSAVGKRISAALKDSKATEAELADIRRGIKAAQDVLTGPKEDVLGAVAAPGVSGKTEAKANKSADVKVDKPDAGFSKLTTGSQAITHIVKNGSLFQRFVAERIRNFMVGVRFVVVEEGDATPANILAEMEGARGLFVYTPGLKDRTIYVRGSSFGDQQGINNVTVLHELLHAATASRITAGLVKGFKNASLQKFMREMSGVMKSAEDAYRAGIRTGAVSSELQDLVEADAGNVEFDDRGRPKFQIFNDHNEFLAYGMSSPEFQKFLMGVQGVRKETSIFSRFTNSIRDLFGIKQGEATAFSDLIDITDKMLDTRLTAIKMGRTSLQQKGPLTEEQKAQREKEKAVSRAIKAVDRSFEAEKISEETEVLQRLRSLDVAPVLKEISVGLSSLQKKAISKALSTPLVSEIGGVNVPELINTNSLLEQMEAAKMEMLRAGAKLVDDIKRLLPTEASREKVSRAALIFTASRLDPRVDKSVVRLNKIYDDLTADEKKALDEIAGYYGDIMDNYDYLLGENVKALRPGEAAKLTAALREALGKDNRIPFYVPLARDQNGEFYLRVGTTEFHIRKTEAERNRLAEAIAKERNTTVEQLLQDKEIEVGNDIEVLRKKVLDSSDALRRIFIMIEDADFTAEEQGASLQKAKDGMKDSIFQLWLHMQPESSSRKQFIHRNKSTPAGFRTDIIQNLAESVLKFSNNMARLEYAPQLRKSISQAQASIENRPAYSPYVTEMALRVNDTLAPEKQSTAMGLARFGNSFTFGYYMSESTALLQLLSVYQVGTAQLAKQYPIAAVAKEAAKMSQIWNTTGVKNEYGDWVMPTIEQALNVKSRPTDSAKVRLDKEQDRAFIDAMHERNVSEATGARDLQGYKDLPTEKYGSKYEQAKRVGRFVVGGLIHATERLSREFMFMSSAHLVRDKAVAEFRKTAEYKNAPDKIAAERAFGIANIDTWADKAAKDTNAALFNYSESAKPRYMRGAAGRVALQFFTYQLNVGSFIARNFIGMIKPLPGETRVECMRAFSTLMATTFSLGGTQALFGGPIVLGLISIIMKLSKGADEPDELKDIDLYERFKIFLHEQLGDVTIGGKPLSKIIDQGPLNAFTGLDVSSRVSVSNVLTPPEVKAARTPREGVLNYAQMYGGANLQAVLSIADGVDLLIKGEHYRGFEKLVPWAAVRNKMTAYRQYTEGEKGLKLGDEVVEAELFYAGELLGQAVGLRPVLLSDVTAANRKAHEIVSKVVDKRQAILDRLDRADRKGDDKAYLAALEDQEKFNAKTSLEFPRMKISEEDRYNFIKGRNEDRRTSFGGFQSTPQNEVLAGQITNRSRGGLVKREKEMAEKNPR